MPEERLTAPIGVNWAENRHLVPYIPRCAWGSGHESHVQCDLQGIYFDHANPAPTEFFCTYHRQLVTELSDGLGNPPIEWSLAV